TAGIGVAGAQDNGTQVYNGAGHWGTQTCGDGGFTAMDPSVPSLVLGACQRVQIERTLSVTGTAAWHPADYGIDDNDPTQFISPLAIDQAYPQAVYFGTFRLWRSRDGGGQWTAISPDL